MLKIAICDDEASEQKRLREWLAGHFAAHNLCCKFIEYNCGEALYADYDDWSMHFDFVFLDIYMGSMNGIETADAIRKHDSMVSIVFQCHLLKRFLLNLAKVSFFTPNQKT